MERREMKQTAIIMAGEYYDKFGDNMEFINKEFEEEFSQMTDADHDELILMIFEAIEDMNLSEYLDEL